MYRKRVEAKAPSNLPRVLLAPLPQQKVYDPQGRACLGCWCLCLCPSLSPRDSRYPTQSGWLEEQTFPVPHPGGGKLAMQGWVGLAPSQASVRRRPSPHGVIPLCVSASRSLPQDPSPTGVGFTPIPSSCLIRLFKGPMSERGPGGRGSAHDTPILHALLRRDADSPPTEGSTSATVCANS